LRSNILCLETSAAKCSVALAKKGGSVVYKEAGESYAHVSQITLLIRDCLADANVLFEDLDAIAISGGPGSYTGLRVGTSTAKGICFANDIPLIALDTLEVIAHTIIQDRGNDNKGLFISVIDARRDEVYMAAYEADLSKVIKEKAYILKTDSFSDQNGNYEKIIIGGDAAEKASKIIESDHIIYKNIIPDAGHMAPLALRAYQKEDFVHLSSFTPYYLKPPNITISKKQFFRKN